MLVLTRKVGEEIVIGENVALRILKTQGNRVHIGIEAPIEMSIHRKEVVLCDPSAEQETSVKH